MIYAMVVQVFKTYFLIEYNMYILMIQFEQIISDTRRSVHISAALIEDVAIQLYSSDGFTFIASLRQNSNSVGTIFSFGSENQR